MTVSRRTVWIWALQESKLNYAYSAFHARSTAKGNSHRQVTHDTDRTVLSCLLWRCELSRLDRQTGAFCVWSVSECVGRRSATAERTCRADSIHIAWHDTDSTVLSCLAGGVNWTLDARRTIAQANCGGWPAEDIAPGSPCWRRRLKKLWK